MKKTLIASAMVCSLVIFAVPVFAQHGGYNGQMHGGRYWNQNSQQGSHMNYCGDYGWNHDGMNGSVVTKMGTIASVDVKGSFFTVTDSDGKSFKVMVNPRTTFSETSEVIAQRNLRRTNPAERPQTFATPKVLSLGDLKAGDWVTIRSFNTGTTAIDAANVQVVQKK